MFFPAEYERRRVSRMRLPLSQIENNGDHILGNIWGAIPFKIGGFAATVLLILMIFVSIVMAVTGCVLWPFLISCQQADVPLAESAGKLLTAGIVGAVVSFVMAFITAFMAQHFRFVSCLSTSYAAGLVAVILTMALTGVNVTGAALDSVFAGPFILFLLQGILAILLAFLPALLSAVLGWLVHTIGMAVTGHGGSK